MLELFFLVIPHQALGTDYVGLINDTYEIQMEGEAFKITQQSLDNFIYDGYLDTVGEFVFWNVLETPEGYNAYFETAWNQYNNVNIPLLDEYIQIPSDAVFLVGFREGVRIYETFGEGDEGTYYDGSAVIPENCANNLDSCMVYPLPMFGIK